MCGIVGYAGYRQAAPLLLDGLSKLEYRGYDSAGVCIQGPEGLEVAKSRGRLQILSEKIQAGAGLPGLVGVGHTRWATHGAPSDENSHPHLSQNGKIAVVHNGIIENYLELRERLTKEGVSFCSDTDTEVVSNLIARLYEEQGDLLEAVRMAVARLEGSYALGIVCRDEPGQIIAAKKDSPLIFGFGEGENFIASDVPAILKYTRQVAYLDEGDMAVFTASGVTFYNALGEQVEKKPEKITWELSDAERGGYPHFMLKEIHEQPRALRDTISPRVQKGRVVLDDVQLSREYLEGLKRIYIVACGSAHYVGCLGKYILERICRIPVEPIQASEFRYADPVLCSKTLVVIISQSGETADTLAALREAKRRGARTLAIVNVVGSAIAKAADQVIYTWAGPEIAVASTKAYMVQLCTLYLFAFRLAYARGRLSEAETRRLTAELLRAGEVIQPRLADCEQIKYLASRFVNTQSCFFIGRGFDYALSLEGSLKLKEISYVHSDAYAAGELKHGTISLITDGVPVIALATQKQVYEKTISNAKETKSRGARVILFTTKDVVVPEGVADYVVRLDDYDELLMPLQLIVPLQLFAYYMAVLRGCDVDKPRNLAKSVTVE